MSTRSEIKGQIEGPAGAIEVAYAAEVEGDFSASGICAAVCHPHPLHGGTMDNKVVTTLARVYRELGIPAVRFNFRGAGASAGDHDGGVGEVEDLGAVIAWFRTLTGASKVALAGFSFGTGVVSNYCRRGEDVCHALFVAPPVGRYNFAPVAGYPCPVCVVMGDSDDLVDPAGVFRWAEGLIPPPAMIRMAGAGHFFHGRLVELRQRLVDTLKTQLNPGRS